MHNDMSDFLHTCRLSKQVASGESTITILSDINLAVKTGETLAILGASGSGKTTLLTLLAGLDLPTSGDIYLQQHHLNKLNEEKRAALRGKYVGFVFQSFQLLPNLTAMENVMLPLEIQSIPTAIARQKSRYWLEQVGLGPRMEHYPLKLSGGEQQRVAIARAFVTQPAVIFADEMTGNLDTHTGALISDLIFSLNEKLKTTLIMVTHDENLAARCQRQLLLQDGCLHAC